MLDREGLANQLYACVDGEQTIEEFEDWFDSESWNVHRQNDKPLIDAVFRIESLYSAFEDGRLPKDVLLRNFRELANAVRPFAASRVYAEPVELE